MAGLGKPNTSVEVQIRALRCNLKDLRRRANNSLFRDEAKRALKKGKKVRYEDWGTGQYIHLKDKQIQDESGAIFDESIFFAREGWHIYEELAEEIKK